MAASRPRPSKLRDVAPLPVAHRDAPRHLERLGRPGELGQRLRRCGRAGGERQREDAEDVSQLECFCITASSASWLGFSTSASRQIFFASSCLPCVQSTSPRCAAISGSERELYAICRYLSASGLLPRR